MVPVQPGVARHRSARPAAWVLAACNLFVRLVTQGRRIPPDEGRDEGWTRLEMLAAIKEADARVEAAQRAIDESEESERRQTSATKSQRTKRTPKKKSGEKEKSPENDDTLERRTAIPGPKAGEGSKNE